jgi:hypothetical protein
VKSKRRRRRIGDRDEDGGVIRNETNGGGVGGDIWY